MSARFIRLRIAGFKSFAEPANVDILPGLTGIVGPNGCGKSNVVEALRWAMGESSARSLRGGEMDDLIFAGTTGRSARNLAEVTLTLENAAGLGPGAFAEQDQLEVTRRAERGSGSDYRLNGKAIRGRDVQTLFADLASGARSSAMVSQGRVAMLVGAKPEERRSILEEAAGITGLHARRHEAELKLRATETNLTRAEDLRGQLEERLSGLTEQSGQAGRYRKISAELRDAETTLLVLLHARARQAVERAAAMAAAARQALVAAEEAAETAVITEFEANQLLPGLRDMASEARTALERARVAAEGVAREEARAKQAEQEAAARLQQAQADHEAASLRLHDAQETLARLDAENTALAGARDAMPARQAEVEQELFRLAAEIRMASEQMELLTADVAARRNRAEQARAALDSAMARHARQAEAHAALAAELATLQAEMPEDAMLGAAAETMRDRADALIAAREGAELARQRRADAQLALSVAQNAEESARKRQAEGKAALEAARNRHAALVRDRDALARRRSEAEAGLVPQAERDALSAAVQDAEAARQRCITALETAESERVAAGAALVAATAKVQEDRAAREALEASCRVTEAALKRAEQEAATLTRDREAAERDALPDSVLAAAQEARAGEETRLAAAETALAAAEEKLAACTAEARRTELALDRLQAEITQASAQAEGLAQALGEDATDGAFPPVSEALRVPEGLEAALAAALADGLDAPVLPGDARDGDAPRGWQGHIQANMPPLPGGAVALASLIKAPQALRDALAGAGLIEHPEAAESLQAQLVPGQCVVTRTGGLWRWDGYRILPGQPDAAAARLAARRRLRETQEVLARAEQNAPTMREDAAMAARALAEADGAMRVARTERAAIETTLGRARTAEAETARRHAASRARLEAVLPQHERASQALEAARESARIARQGREALIDPASLQAVQQAARSAEQSAIAAEAKARDARRVAEQTLDAARQRAQSIESRHNGAETRLASILPDLSRLSDEADAAQAALQAAENAQDGNLASAEAREALQAAMTEAEQAEAGFAATRTALGAAEAEAERSRHAHQAMQELALERRTRIAALTPREASLAAELADAQAALAAAEASVSLTAAPEHDPETGQSDLIALRDQTLALRTAEEVAREQRAALTAEAGILVMRGETIEAGLREWRERAAAAEAGVSDATARLTQAQAGHEQLAEIAQASAMQQESARALAAAEATHLAAVQARLQAETVLTQAQEQRRVADAGLGTAREGVLRAEGKSEQADAILAQLLAETPEPPRAPAGDLTEEAETSLRRRIARLTRERDDMGPVNLRAEIEAQEAQERIETILREHSEIEAAIARLRGSVNALNKEGRERLMAVFTEVDHHFQSLFSRMFGGGRAHLGLVGSDDPLQAGLEIYAQPPGKKLATLSLLSGGEQALTALSLIFAVFRCNPAPICVLDEVDAPLDDANVARFCALLGDMAQEAGTRFLVVTHHQLTMAHMDRLFGVTMQERGVSRVLSVDLERAAEMATSRKPEAVHEAR